MKTIHVDELREIARRLTHKELVGGQLVASGK